MVSCQWELTSGAREGQACGRGKNVFCKTHEPKATRQAERSSESSHLLGDYLADKFTRQLKGVITSNTYGGADYSTSWIGGPKDMVSNQSGLNRDMTRGGPLQQLESITRPAIVSMWLEQELAKVTIRNKLRPIAVRHCRIASTAVCDQFCKGIYSSASVIKFGAFI